MTQVKEEFVLFYCTNSIYSNFHPAEFRDEELMSILPKSSKFCRQMDFWFSHVEQYMHASKALLFLDIPMFDQILSVSNPKVAKQLGRLVEQFDDEVWTATARDIVTRGCFLKFDQNKLLQQQMKVDGAGRIFVECAPRDQRWGIGLGIKNLKRLKPSHWQGQNWLGKCLDNTLKHLNHGTEPKLLKYFGSDSIPKVEKNLQFNANNDLDKCH